MVTRRPTCRRSSAVRATLDALAAALILAFWGGPVPATAADPGVVVLKTTPSKCTQAEPILQPYEPITGGYTHDSSDTGFYDVNLSLKIRLLPWCFTPRWVHPYFAMATRFGFYWGTRSNSPVIGKSYNPLLLFRFLPRQKTLPSTGRYTERAEYIDLIPYAHQSNGQLIHTSQEYEGELASLKIPSYTDNFIHRGWDYAGLVWKKSWGSGSDIATDVATYVEGRYFIPNGFLQGPEDQYHSWENNTQGKPRDAVDGLSVTAEYPSAYAHFAVDPSEIHCPENDTVKCLFSKLRLNLTATYLTGYNTPFKYSTERVELGFQVLTLPLAAWIQHGYMSSLAMYYEKVSSIGLEVRFESF